MKSYDLAIIGSGPGGYVAALYASRFKMSVCVIEKGPIGGTCLNQGCIPTKSLLHSASLVSKIKTAATYGVRTDGAAIDFHRMMARKEEVVTRLKAGIETLFKGSKIDLVRGVAKLTAPDTIAVDGANAVRARNIIVATGSGVMELPGIRIDEADVLSSDGILKIESAPESLAIIGGGVIGCEFADLFNKLGTKVTIVEMTERLLPGQSREIARKLETIFAKRGVAAHLSSKVEAIEKKGASMTLSLSSGKSVEARKVLVCVGRKPATEGLGLEGLGIQTDRGRIRVDEFLRTGVANIYAIGDCVTGPLLAHKASYDGMVACDNIAGQKRKVDYSNVPSCIWTDPEIASVGMNEEEAKAMRADAKVAKFPYLGSGKAYLEGKTEGFVKIIGTPAGDILGVEIFGADACNLIGEATLAKTAGVRIQDWSRVVHGHPTLSEILQEAAHVFTGKAIHGI